MLNKIDLANDNELAEVESRIQEVNPLAPIIRTQHGKVNLDAILDVGAFSLDRVLIDDPEFLDPDAEHQHDLTVTSVGIELEGDLDLERLNDWLGNLLQTKGTDIFRSKGILSIAGMEERYVFQGVHMLLDGQPNGTWGDTERRNRLVFIGRNLDRQSLEESFRSCLA